MSVIDIVARIVIGLLLVPVLLVLLDLGLESAGAVPTNPIVAFIDDAAAAVTPDALTTVFPNQGALQTTLLVTVMYALLAGAVGMLARVAREAVAVASRQRLQRQQRRQQERASKQDSPEV